MDKVSLTVRGVSRRTRAIPQVNHITICVGREHQLSVVYTTGFIWANVILVLYDYLLVIVIRL